MRLLARILNSAHPVHGLRCVTVPGNPRPKERPRFNRNTGNAYVSKNERLAAKQMRALLEESGVRCDPGRLAVAFLFVRKDRTKVDASNLVKFFEDAANRVLWRDDSQIVSLHAEVIIDPAFPRTVVAVASL